jgi:hypothetical protein
MNHTVDVSVLLVISISCHHEEGDAKLQFEGHWLVADGQHVFSKVMISS